MPEQPMICLTVTDLCLVIALTALAVAGATMIYNFIRSGYWW